MIRLSKLPEPAWLVANKQRKTAEYLVAPATRKPSPWREPTVVTTLKAETANKCMYCESWIDGPGYSAVEHIKPKKVFPDMVLEWSNLGLVCDRCNTNKGMYWTDNLDLQLLNPFVDDVESHLRFDGPLTVAVMGSSRGKNTVRKLKFAKRADLMIARMARIEDLDERLSLWHSESDPEKKQLFSEDVEQAIASDREFSAVLRAYAARQGYPNP